MPPTYDPYKYSFFGGEKGSKEYNRYWIGNNSNRSAEQRFFPPSYFGNGLGAIKLTYAQPTHHRLAFFESGLVGN